MLHGYSAVTFDAPTSDASVGTPGVLPSHTSFTAVWMASPLSFGTAVVPQNTSSAATASVSLVGGRRESNSARKRVLSHRRRMSSGRRRPSSPSSVTGCRPRAGTTSARRRRMRAGTRRPSRALPPPVLRRDDDALVAVTPTMTSGAPVASGSAGRCRSAASPYTSPPRHRLARLVVVLGDEPGRAPATSRCWGCSTPSHRANASAVSATPRA